MRPPKFSPNWPIGRRVRISNIFKHGGRPPSGILKILIFDHATVIEVLICCCVPNFIRIGSRVWPQTPITAECSMRRCQAIAVARQQPLPWQPHHGGHVGNLMDCDHPSFVPIGPLGGELWHFQYFPTWRPSAIWNFKNFNI